MVWPLLLEAAIARGGTWDIDQRPCTVVCKYRCRAFDDGRDSQTVGSSKMALVVARSGDGGRLGLRPV